MKFYYTGAEKFDDLQPNIDKSLGGFISCTPIPNAQVSNLFSDISKFGLEKNNFTVIGMALRNELPNDVTDILLWFEFPAGFITNLEVAIVVVNDDGEGNLSIEKLPNQSSLPYFSEFNEADTMANQINIGDLTKGSYLGLFIKRTFIDTASEDLSCDALEENVDEEGEFKDDPVTEEDVSLKLSWTDTP